MDNYLNERPVTIDVRELKDGEMVNTVTYFTTKRILSIIKFVVDPIFYIRSLWQRASHTIKRDIYIRKVKAHNLIIEIRSYLNI